jgi:hypothetical protein
MCRFGIGLAAILLIVSTDRGIAQETLGANVLVGSNRTVTLQPLSVQGQIGLNVAVGVAALHLGLPRR